MNPSPEVYEFEGFRVDALKRLVTRRDGEVVSLAPKAFDTLLHLVRHPGEVLEKDALMQAVWFDTAVEENNLNQSISALRRALGEKAGEHRFIVTVPGRGYKFVATVRRLDDNGEAAESVSDNSPQGAAETELVEETPGTEPREGETSKNLVRRHAEFNVRSSKRIRVTIFAALAIAGIIFVGFLISRATREAPPTSIKTIAVLPFKPLVAENRNEALELGMAESLIAKLSGIDELNVRPLESVRRIATGSKDSLAIGRELQAEAVVEGSIQMAGDRIRIMARFVRTSDGKQLWTGQFDEMLSDIFNVQDSISAKVASALQKTLKETGKKRQTENVAAYQLYVNGRLHASRLTRDEIEKSIASYNAAIELDPNYALPYVGLSRAYRSFSLTSDLPSEETMPKAKAAAQRALELDETEPEAHIALGLIAFLYDWDWASAEKHYLRALELDPNNVSAHSGYAHLLSNTGQHDKALAEARRARELNPVSVSPVQGQLLHYAGRMDEALESLKQTLDLDPNLWLTHLVLSRVYEEKGMHDEAIAAATKARELSKVNSEAIACVGYSLAKAGRHDEARRILGELKELSTQRYVPPYNLALVSNALGDRDAALSYLEKGFAERDVRMVFLLIEPKWNNLRGESRFRELLQRMRLE